MADEIQAQPKQRAVRVEQVVLDDGRQGWKYSDGSIRNDHGHMIEPLAGKFTITQENASMLVRQRWEKSREEFSGGLAEEMKVAGPAKAWRRIGQRTARLLEDAKSARGFADLARFAGEAGGFVPMARGREEMQEQQQDQPTIVVMLMQYIQSLQSPPSDVIDGEIRD